MENNRLLHFVKSMCALLQQSPNEQLILEQGASLLKTLVQHDDWLPEMFTQPHAQYYQQYLLYADPLERFSVVSFVWGPGQKTPVHNHRTWGLIGMLRGQEIDTPFFKESDGHYRRGVSAFLLPGQVVSVSPATHDIHEVENFYADRSSISIHVYGGNIGRIERQVFDPVSGQEKTFVSGYSHSVVPNLWN